MFGFSTAKLIGLGLGLLGVLAFIGLSLHWKSEMTSRGKELATQCAATRAAADNAKLDCKQVSAQIGQLGQSIATLKAAIVDQNAKVAALGAETVKQQNIAAVAQKQAAKRADVATATSQRLSASAAHSAPGKPCEASAALKGAWQ